MKKKKKGKKNASSNPTTQTSPVCFFPHHHCAPGQPSVCMFVQTPPGGSSHWSYSAAVSSPCSVHNDPPAACLQFSNRRHCNSCICRACCAQPPARGFFPATILAEACWWASEWKHSKENRILNVFCSQQEPGQPAGCCLCLCLQEDFCWPGWPGEGRKSKEKRSSGVSAS